MLKQTFSKTERTEWREVFYSLIVQKDAIKASHLKLAKKLSFARWN